MRAVLDTNILARSVAAPGGPAAELLEHLQPPHVLVASTHTLDELARVLRYPRLRRMHGRDDAEIDTLCNELRDASVVVSTPPEAVPVIVPDDRDDDFVIAAALVGGATVIATRDSHLHADRVRQYCADHGIRVLTDLELLGELRADDDEGGG